MFTLLKDSDSDEAENSSDEAQSKVRNHAQIPPTDQRSPSPVIQQKTDEELLEERVG